jgi:hypothetical protein
MRFSYSKLIPESSQLTHVAVTSAAAATTPSACPDRTLHNAIIAVLSLKNQTKKEDALKSWENDSGDETLSPHSLVHVIQKVYKLAELPTALKGNDASDFDTLQKVCNELKFTLLFASVRKLLGCVLWVKNSRFQMLENGCPKIDPSQSHNITVDQLVLL